MFRRCHRVPERVSQSYIVVVVVPVGFVLFKSINVQTMSYSPGGPLKSLEVIILIFFLSASSSIHVSPQQPMFRQYLRASEGMSRFCSCSCCCCSSLCNSILSMFRRCHRAPERVSQSVIVVFVVSVELV